jgi:hypothetical protein
MDTMSDLKTRVRPFPNTVVSLLLLATAALIAGQAVFSAEAGAQSASASVPSTEQRALDDATSRAIYGQRYVGLYDGDDFIGDHAVTKEELLLIVDRMLRDIEAGKILVESSDAELLRTVVVEFQEKLMDLNNRVQVLDAEMQVRHKRDVVLTEQTLQVKEEANDLMAKITTFAEDLRRFVLDQAAANVGELEAAAENLKRFDERIDEIVLEIGDLQASLEVSVADLLKRIEELKHELSVTTSRFGTLRTETLSTYDTLVSRMDDLEKRLTDALRSAEEKIAAQEQRIGQLEHQLAVNQAKYYAHLTAVRQLFLALSARLSALESDRSGASSGGPSGAEAGAEAEN